MKKGKIIMIILLAVLLIFIICGLYNPLSVRRFKLESGKISQTVRIALISDLHSCKYGKGQKKLIKALDKESPDIVCFAGDVFDDKLRNDNSEIFLSDISEKYPCYYVTGNHEHRMSAPDFAAKMVFLESCGIERLSNEGKMISVNGQELVIAGVDDPHAHSYNSMSGVLHQMKSEMPEDVFSLLLSHRPEHFSDYTGCGFDLTLCGHAHGGQWRIPFIMENGLLAPHQGLLPKYTNGLYSLGDCSMIVSRGLAKESTIVPRFYNRPEIIIVELCAK